MIDPESRYYGVNTARRTMPDGRVAAYMRRRFLPRGAALPVLIQVTVQPNQRLDQIAAVSLGDPEQFWRICDANDAMNPAELTERPGRILRVPLPQAGDR